MYPVTPTTFNSNIYDPSWYTRDFFHSPDGSREFPNHHCKVTWNSSLPHITALRNAVDIGCRDGEYTRYLQHNFNHVYCFDYRKRKLFSHNVDLKSVTHFRCGLSNKHSVESVSGGGSMTSGKIPKEKWYDEQLYTLDEFNLKDIDYIKIDVDGFELRVLEGAINTIKKYSPLIVAEALNDDTTSIDFCTKLGYEIADWDTTKRNVILKKR